MSLIAGRGPLSKDPSGWFTPTIPDDVVFIEPHPRRVQALRGNRSVIDTEHALLVHRRGHALSYAFPADAVDELAAEPLPEAPGYVTVAWDAVDAWLEEGGRLAPYPPTPSPGGAGRPPPGGRGGGVDGTTLVDTTDTVVVFETSVDTRLYVDPTHVRTDLLRRSDTTSYCNYKGWATYWSATVGDVVGQQVIADVAWSYDDTPPETLPVKGFLSFDAARADVLAELPGAR